MICCVATASPFDLQGDSFNDSQRLPPAPLALVEPHVLSRYNLAERQGWQPQLTQFLQKTARQ